MGEPVILALDIGSSSRRGQLIDREGRFIAGETPRRIQKIDYAADGAATFDPEVLTADIHWLLDELTDRSRHLGARIIGVASSCMWHSIVGSDASGDPTMPIITWADSRPEASADHLRTRLDHRTVHARTGCPLRAQYLPAKLHWLRESDPATFDATTHWSSPADFALQQILNQPTTSASMASGTGLMNQNAGIWDIDLLSALSVRPDSLAPIDERVTSRLSTTHHHRWPELAEAVWFPAIGDGAAATIGVGARNPGDLTISIGTTSAVRLAHHPSNDRPPAQAWRYLLEPGRPVTGGALSDGGSTLDRLRRDLQVPDDVEALAARKPAPPTDGPTTPDLLTGGQRGPLWATDQPLIRLHGWDHPDPVATWKEAIRQVCERLAEIVGTLEAAHPVERVICTGGAHDRSPLWQAALTVALDRPVESALSTESSLIGAGALAWDRIARSGPDGP